MRQDKEYRLRYNAGQEELKLWQRKESFHHGNNLEHSVIKHVQKAFLKTSLVAQMVRRLPEMRRPAFNPWVGKISSGNHSSILAWKIPWTEEFGGLQSMGSQRVGHN